MLSTFQLIAFFLPSLYLVLHVECGFVEIILSIFYDVYAPATADAATFHMHTHNRVLEMFTPQNANFLLSSNVCTFEGFVSINAIDSY